MAENESSKNQDMQVASGSSGAVTPARTDVMPPAGAKSTSFTITLDEKGGVSISPSADKGKKADDKKKMPRGSTVFRHA
jgi:P pilus assembly chaperone PapD